MSILKALEEFLRDIAEQQAAQQAAPRGVRRPPPARPGPPAPVGQPVVDAEVIEVPRLHEAVSQHVTQHLDISEIGKRTSQLGAEVVQETAKHTSQRREKFDHKLGRLQATQPATSLAGTSATSPVDLAGSPPRPNDIAQLLRSPASIRQAIILNEVLTRPEQRW